MRTGYRSSKQDMDGFRITFIGTLSYGHFQELLIGLKPTFAVTI